MKEGSLENLAAVAARTMREQWPNRSPGKKASPLVDHIWLAGHQLDSPGLGFEPLNSGQQI